MTPDPTLTDEELAEIDQRLAQFWSSAGRPWRMEFEKVLTWCGRLIAALRASREEVDRLRELADFARLLGPARMVLDRCAMNGGDQERQDAGDMAQRIVDLIGHPVTDEPPHALVERDALRAEVERLRKCAEWARWHIDNEWSNGPTGASDEWRVFLSIVGPDEGGPPPTLGP